MKKKGTIVGKRTAKGIKENHKGNGDDKVANQNVY